MNKSEKLTARPLLVWENSKAAGEREATVQELRTSDNVHSTMPVIRIVSSGFGNQQVIKNAKSTVSMSSLRCAA
jgi:hypothetical protein